MLLNSSDLSNFEGINNEILASYSDLNNVLSHYVSLFLVGSLIVLLLHFVSISIIYIWFYNYSDILNKLNISKSKLLFDLLIPFFVFRYFFKLYYDLKPSFLHRFKINFLIFFLLFLGIFLHISILFILYLYVIYLFYFVLKKYTLNKKIMIVYILSFGFGFFAIILFDMYSRYKLTH